MDLKIDRHLASDMGRVVILAVLFASMAVFLGRPGIKDFLLDIQGMREILQGGHGGSGQILSAFLFILLWAGLISAGVPRLWASAVGGIIYGALMGTLLSILASLLGASILYEAGHSLLAGMVERRMGDNLRVWRRRFQENAFWWVLYGRLFPFSNSTLMSLLCGSCRVSYRGFMLGSLLGFIPLAVVFATYGSGGVKGNLWQITVATVLLVLSFFSRKLFGKLFPATIRTSQQPF
jgi:uncharacterized membrane protein YdjX (TVP38/TMEM64 family)